jgi:hypothetical protein
MGNMKSRLFLTDNARRLFQILQGLSELSKVWKYSKVSIIGYEPHYQAMAV